MKQTPIEWLFNELWNTDKDKFTWHSILEKAKEMEKKEIIEAFENRDFVWKNISGETYYKKKYQNNE